MKKVNVPCVINLVIILSNILQHNKLSSARVGVCFKTLKKNDKSSRLHPTRKFFMYRKISISKILHLSSLIFFSIVLYCPRKISTMLRAGSREPFLYFLWIPCAPGAHDSSTYQPVTVEIIKACQIFENLHGPIVLCN